MKVITLNPKYYDQRDYTFLLEAISSKLTGQSKFWTLLPWIFFTAGHEKYENSFFLLRQKLE